jgi:hypothetical protein
VSVTTALVNVTEVKVEALLSMYMRPPLPVRALTFDISEVPIETDVALTIYRRPPLA